MSCRAAFVAAVAEQLDAEPVCPLDTWRMTGLRIVPPRPLRGPPSDERPSAVLPSVDVQPPVVRG